MKVFIFLLCLVLVIISSAGAEEQDTEVRSDHGVVVDRQVREAGQKLKYKSVGKQKKRKENTKVRRKNQAKQEKPRKKKNSNTVNRRKNRKGKKKGRKNSKKTKSMGKVKGKGKRKNKKGKKKHNKRKNKKRSKKKSKTENKVKQTQSKSSNTARQTDTECVQTICDKGKKFNKYQTQLRKAKRIQSWVDTMGKKKEKSATTFQNASSAIKNATSNGAQCDGGSIPEEAKTADETLANCSSTASDLCSSSKISGLNTSLIAECEPKLEAYITAYKACLVSTECSCFTALTLVDDSCTTFNSMESSTKAAKKKCTGSSEKGSFGDCRQQERQVAYYGEKCKACTGTMTTKAPSVVARFLKQRQFQRLAGIV